MSKQRGAISQKILLAAIVVAAILIAGTYVIGHRTTTNNSNNQQDGWSTYKSDKYGFSFDYMTEWGKPKVEEVMPPKLKQGPGLPTIKDHKGKEYKISFTDKKIFSDTGDITVTIDSKDYSTTVCTADNQCSQTGTLSEASVKSMIESSKDYALKSDQQTYSFLYGSSAKSNLSIYKIAHLNKINSEVAMLSYTYNIPLDCNNKLKSPKSDFCIAQNDYSNLNKFVSSIRDD